MAEAPDRDLDDVVTVTQDGVTVEKRFTTDEFPVPAVKFVLRSETDEAVEIRLIDEVPDSFEMESIGFHPEYEGDAWTAYRDHRVEYERTLDPDEEVTTVYGVRIDDPASGAQFLREPRIERVSDATSAADPEEILGRETTGAVRDALAGEGDLAGDAEAEDGVDLDLDEPADVGVDAAPADGDESADVDLDLGDPDDGAAAEGGPAEDDDLDLDLDGPADADAAEADPSEAEGVELDGDESASAAVEETEESVGEVDLEGGEAADDEVGPDAGPAPRSVDGDLTPAVEPTAGDATAAADERAGAASGALPGSVVAALAAEVREGTADEDDLDALREALAPDREPEIPRSLEVRIDRLQNRTEDLAAYTDALEAFLDEEGTAQEVLDDLDDRTAALRDDLDAVESETAALDGTVADHDERLADVEATVGDLEADVASLDDGLDDLDATVEDLEADLDDLAGDAETSVEDLRETLDDLEATMADVEDEIEDLQSFRDRMRDAFGS